MDEAKIEDNSLEAYCVHLGLMQAPEAHFGFLIDDPFSRAASPSLGMDHYSLWLTEEGIPHSLILQPYKNSFEWAHGVIEWKAICAKWGLVWRQLPDGTGWYNPTKTHCIEFTRDPEVWDHAPRPYRELMNERSVAENKLLM